MTDLRIKKLEESKNLISFEEITTGIKVQVMKDTFINAVNKLKYWRENLDTPGFDSILYYLISKADDRNKLKFFVGFPEETIAYILWYTAINKKDFWGTWSKK